MHNYSPNHKLLNGAKLLLHLQILLHERMQLFLGELALLVLIPAVESQLGIIKPDRSDRGNKAAACQ